MTIAFKGGDLFAMLFGGIIESYDTPSAPTESGTATEFDEEMLDTVVEIIEEIHKTVTFWVYPEENYNEETGETILGDAVQYPNKQIIPPYEVDLKYVYADVAQAGDMLSGVPAKDIEFTPTNGMKVTINSDVWSIVRVMPIYASERIVLYLFQLRR